MLVGRSTLAVAFSALSELHNKTPSLLVGKVALGQFRLPVRLEGCFSPDSPFAHLGNPVAKSAAQRVVWLRNSVNEETLRGHS
jgi:hypothetical protein